MFDGLFWLYDARHDDKRKQLQLRASEIRTRLTEIAGLDGDALTDEIRTESDTLVPPSTGIRGNPDAGCHRRRGQKTDRPRNCGCTRMPRMPKRAPCGTLQGRASFGRYLSGFADGEQLSGAETRACRASRNYHVRQRDPVGCAAVRGAGRRVARGRGNPGARERQSRRIKPRSSNGYSPASAVRRLGVAMPGVGVGIASYPVITEGPDPAFVAADGVKEATAGTLTANALLPKRLQGRILFRLEDVMTVTGLESGLSADLSASLSNQLDAQLIGAGDATVRGFLATAANGGLAAYADPATAIDFAGAAEQAARGVDGKYAGGEDECAWVIGTATYQKLAAFDSVERQCIGNRAATPAVARLHGVREHPGRRGEHSIRGFSPNSARWNPLMPCVPFGKG